MLGLLRLALLPAACLMIYIYWKDKAEKEPLSLLAGLFGLGALTVVSAILFGTLLQALEEELFEPDSVSAVLFDNFIATALIEEGGKHFVLKKATWKSPHFSHLFDAVVYAVTVSLGFAAVENIAYVLSEQSYETAVLRALFSVPGHAVNAVFMGLWYGIARDRENLGLHRESRRALRRALLIPVLLHGFYDFCLSMGDGIFTAVFFVFEIAVTVLAVANVRRLSKNDRPLSGSANLPDPQTEIREEEKWKG